MESSRMGLKRNAKRAARQEAREAEKKVREWRAESAEELRIKAAKNHQLVSAAKAAAGRWGQSVGLRRLPEITITGVSEGGYTTGPLPYSGGTDTVRTWWGPSVSMTWRHRRRNYQAKYLAEPDTLDVQMEVDIWGRPVWSDANTPAEIGRSLAHEKQCTYS
jgi:hypothetical protein